MASDTPPAGLNGKNGGDVGTESRFYTASTRPALGFGLPDVEGGEPPNKKNKKKNRKKKEPDRKEKSRLGETTQTKKELAK